MKELVATDPLIPPPIKGRFPVTFFTPGDMLTVTVTPETESVPKFSTSMKKLTSPLAICDCGTRAFAPIPGATNQTYTISQSGNFAVEVNANGCVDTSLCYQVIFVGNEDPFKNTDLKVYPNPAGNYLIIEITSKAHKPIERTVTLIDVNGKEVLSQALKKTSEMLDLSGLPPGIYFAKIKVNGVVEYRNLPAPRDAFGTGRQGW